MINGQHFAYAPFSWLPTCRFGFIVKVETKRSLCHFEEHLVARPDIFKSAMSTVVDDFSSPSCGIGSDVHPISIVDPIQWGYEIVQVSPGQTTFNVVHTVAGIASKEINDLIFYVEYPAPSGLTSHF